MSIASHHGAPATAATTAPTKQTVRTPMEIRYRRCRWPMSSDMGRGASVTV